MIISNISKISISKPSEWRRRWRGEIPDRLREKTKKCLEWEPCKPGKDFTGFTQFTYKAKKLFLNEEDLPNQI